MSVELGALADGTAFRQQAADSLLLGVLAQLMQCQRELGVAREELASEIASEIARAKAARPSAGRDSECEREHSEPPPPAVANVAVVLIDEEARALLPGILMVPALPRSDPSFGGVGAGTALRSLWGASELPSLPSAGRELTGRQLAGDGSAVHVHTRAFTGDGSAASVQSSGGGRGRRRRRVADALDLPALAKARVFPRVLFLSLQLQNVDCSTLDASSSAHRIRTVTDGSSTEDVLWTDR